MLTQKARHVHSGRAPKTLPGECPLRNSSPSMMGGLNVVLCHKRLQIWGGHETARSMMRGIQKVKRDAIPTISGLILVQGRESPNAI